MAYNTQNYWVSGLYPLSRIPNKLNFCTPRKILFYIDALYRFPVSIVLLQYPDENDESISLNQETGCFRPQVRAERHLLCWVL
jgi:hypothetical protein